MSANQYEAHARERKADRLANALDGAGILPCDAPYLTAEERKLVEQIAGVKPASEETWALACTKLAVRYDFRARMGRAS